jgi:hypothetical protein
MSDITLTLEQATCFTPSLYNLTAAEIAAVEGKA